jgi:hypothetical protein
MKTNNFKTILEEDEQQYTQERRDKNRAGIWGMLGAYKFVGQLVEMYLPRAFEVLISAVGGNADRPPSEPKDDRSEPGGPSAPDSRR